MFFPPWESQNNSKRLKDPNAMGKWHENRSTCRNTMSLWCVILHLTRTYYENNSLRIILRNYWGLILPQRHQESTAFSRKYAWHSWVFKCDKFTTCFVTNHIVSGGITLSNGLRLFPWYNLFGSNSNMGSRCNWGRTDVTWLYLRNAVGLWKHLLSGDSDWSLTGFLLDFDHFGRLRSGRIEHFLKGVTLTWGNGIRVSLGWRFAGTLHPARCHHAVTRLFHRLWLSLNKEGDVALAWRSECHSTTAEKHCTSHWGPLLPLPSFKIPRKNVSLDPSTATADQVADPEFGPAKTVSHPTPSNPFFCGFRVSLLVWAFALLFQGLGGFHKQSSPCFCVVFRAPNV